MDSFLTPPQEITSLTSTSLCTAEIARLQNSTRLLRETQAQLQELVDSGNDCSEGILAHSIEENVVTLGSQDERISMLRLALLHKGVAVNEEHYGIPNANETKGTTQKIVASGNSGGGERGMVGADGGVHL